MGVIYKCTYIVTLVKGVYDFQVTNRKLGENTDPPLPIMVALNLNLESARPNRKAPCSPLFGVPTIGEGGT
jgi:hypothetical protein